MIIFANMKMSFQIEYRAPFGQSMHLCVTYYNAEMHHRVHDLLMHTDDGNTWEVETSSMVLSHFPIAYVEYHYQVEDDHGKCIRKEWSGVPRVYAIDDSKNYIFQDQWRDLSLQHYLFRWTKRPLAYLKNIPFFDRSIVFRVSAPHIKSSQHVALLGSEGPLGAWNVKHPLPMHYIGDGDWMLSINAYAIRLPLEYKYVVVSDETHDVVEWEKGENRRTKIKRLEWGEQLVLYGGNLRTDCELVCHDDFFNKDNTITHEIRELYI